MLSVFKENYIKMVTRFDSGFHKTVENVMCPRSHTVKIIFSYTQIYMPKFIHSDLYTYINIPKFILSFILRSDIMSQGYF